MMYNVFWVACSKWCVARVVGGGCCVVWCVASDGCSVWCGVGYMCGV